MIRMLIGALALAAAAIPPAVQAKAIEEKNLLSGKEKIEPDSGYIYISGPVRQMGVLLRLPDAEMIAEYEADWAKAYARVHADYPGKLKIWQDHVLTAHRQGRKPREKPIEPTAENFAIPAIESRYPENFGPQFVFAKSEAPEAYSYLMKVKPGRYAYYGPLFFVPNAPMAGMCYCMGTVAFDVKPGTITDAGNFLLVGSGTDPAFPARPEKMEGAEMGLYRPVAGSEQWGALAYGLPETLKSYPNERADFRAHGKLDNFYGITVGRMPPVAGVLAYDRDKVVDLKAAAAAPAVAPEAPAVEPAAEIAAAPAGG